MKIGKAVILSEGCDVALFANGLMVSVAREVANLLKRRGLTVTLVNVQTLKPLDLATISSVLKTHGPAFTIEEHYLNGGLGSAVAEIAAEKRYEGIFKRFGIPDLLGKYIGRAQRLQELYGLTAPSLHQAILKCLGESV